MRQLRSEFLQTVNQIFGRFSDFWKIFRFLEDFQIFGGFLEDFQIFGGFSDFSKIFRFLGDNNSNKDNPRTCDT